MKEPLTELEKEQAKVIGGVILMMLCLLVAGFVLGKFFS